MPRKVGVWGLTKPQLPPSREFGTGFESSSTKNKAKKHGIMSRKTL